MKNLNDYIGNRTRACSAVPQPTASPHTSRSRLCKNNFLLRYNLCSPCTIRKSNFTNLFMYDAKLPFWERNCKEIKLTSCRLKNMTKYNLSYIIKNEKDALGQLKSSQFARYHQYFSKHARICKLPGQHRT